MAINVEFYSFSKRINSTKRPDSGAVTYSCNMINGFSLTHPVLQIVGANNQFNPTLYNYARIADFNDRYYFVEDWKYDKGLWSAYLSVDELASWKLTIGTTTQFVTRCEQGAYWINTTLLDERFKSLPSHDITNIQAHDYPFATDSNYGCYLLRFIGGGENLSDMCVFDEGEFGVFRRTIAKTYGSEFKEALNSILMCRWLPFQKHNLKTTSLESIKEISIDSARKIALSFSPTFVNNGDVDDNVTFVFNTTKLDHPQLLDYGKCLNSSAYTKCNFVWQPVGVIPINMDMLFNTGSVESKIVLDVRSGYAIFSLSANSKLIYTDTFPFGYEITLSSTTIDSWGIVRGLISGVASVATGNIAGAAVSGLSIAAAAIPQTQIRNGGGGFQHSYFWAKPFLQFDFTMVNPCEDIQRFGKPVFQKIQMSKLKGFVQCENADFTAAGATKAEITAVNNYMNGGFYYE